VGPARKSCSPAPTEGRKEAAQASIEGHMEKRKRHTKTSQKRETEICLKKDHEEGEGIVLGSAAK